MKINLIQRIILTIIAIIILYFSFSIRSLFKENFAIAYFPYIIITKNILIILETLIAGILLFFAFSSKKD